MTIPLIMNAAPLDNNENIKVNSNETNFIDKSSMLPKNENKGKKVNGLKQLIQNIHDTSESDENDLYNSLSNYETDTQKSNKPIYKPKNDLRKMSDTKLAYEETPSKESFSNVGLNLENRDELLQKINSVN